MKPGDLVIYATPTNRPKGSLGLVVKKVEDVVPTSNPLVEVQWITGMWAGKRLYMTRDQLRKVSPAPPGQHLAKQGK